MMPALVDQERIFISKFTYRFGIEKIQRGDTVVFWMLVRLLTSGSVVQRLAGCRQCAQDERAHFRCQPPAEQERARLDKVSQPPLIYPYWHQSNNASDRLNAAVGLLLSWPYDAPGQRGRESRQGSAAVNWVSLLC